MQDELISALHTAGIPYSADNVERFMELWLASGSRLPMGQAGPVFMTRGQWLAFVQLHEDRLQWAFQSVAGGRDHIHAKDVEKIAVRIGVPLDHDQVIRLVDDVAAAENESGKHGIPLSIFRLLLTRDAGDVHAEAMFQAWVKGAVGPSSIAIPDEPAEEAPGWVLLASGFAAGIMSRTITAPLDRIKTILQAGQVLKQQPILQQTAAACGPCVEKSALSSSLPPTPQLSAASTLSSASSAALPGGQACVPGNALRTDARTVREVVRVIFNEGGISGFYRGNGTNIIKVAPETATRWWAYEHLKQFICVDPDNITIFERFAAGAGAGVTAQAVVYPLEMVKTRMVLAAAGQYRNPMHCAATIMRCEGPLTLYRGVVASLAGIVPYAGVDLSVYSMLKDRYEDAWPDREPSLPTLLAFGATATMAGQFVSYPLQLVRTRLQADGMAGRPPRYRGVIDCLRQASTGSRGLLGLYTGLGANMMKSVPAMAISYATYEMCKRGLSDMWRSRRLREEQLLTVPPRACLT